MPKKLFISASFTEVDEFVTITKNGVFFSADFMEKNNLNNNTWCQFFTFDEDEHKFGVSFSIDKNEGSYALMNTMKGKYRHANKGRNTRAGAFINGIPVLREIAKKKGGGRFEVKLDKRDDCFTFKVIPSFEISKKPDDIPNDITGIYRYLSKDKHIIYIGEGNIKNRLKESQREDWEINKVEYSVVNDKEERRKYESFHLDEYKKEYGALPPMNIVAGKRKNKENI